ncbi:MAG: HAMP domain-containing sensor histidine kinase [Candidatus Krumholzibacteria bacterium]
MVDTERALESDGNRASPARVVDTHLIGQIVHDLRSPLASIRLDFELLSDKEAMAKMRADPRQHERLILNLGRALGRMERQITDLLDIGNLQAGQLTLRFEQINPAELIASACEQTAVLAERRDQLVELQLGSSVTVFDGDKKRLEQVLVNLLSYLMQVTPVDSTLTIEAEVESDEFQFAIKGGGKQVPVEERESLFEPFFKLRAEVGHVQESGLGLAIAREIIALHGGSVWLESTESGGNTFRVSLPVEHDYESPDS